MLSVTECKMDTLCCQHWKVAFETRYESLASAGTEGMLLLFAEPLAGAPAQWLPHQFLALTTGHGRSNGYFECRRY